MKESFKFILWIKINLFLKGVLYKYSIGTLYITGFKRQEFRYLGQLNLESIQYKSLGQVNLEL